MFEVERPEEGEVGRWHQTDVVTVFADAEIGHETEGLVVRPTLDNRVEVHQEAEVQGETDLLHPGRIVLFTTLLVAFAAVVGTDTDTSNGRQVAERTLSGTDTVERVEADRDDTVALVDDTIVAKHVLLAFEAKVAIKVQHDVMSACYVATIEEVESGTSIHVIRFGQMHARAEGEIRILGIDEIAIVPFGHGRGKEKACAEHQGEADSGLFLFCRFHKNVGFQ